MGYHNAGFAVAGIDNRPQPRYPFSFRQADALDYVAAHGHAYDVIHASPPCQLHSKAWKIRKRAHPDLIAETREALQATGKPYVIENVPGAPLIDPIVLCGAMFGLRTYRDRLFESNVKLTAPGHPPHLAPQTKMGRPPQPGEMIQVVGNFAGAQLVREDWGMPWANRDELREAIPPAYTEFIGTQLLAHLAVSA